MSETVVDREELSALQDNISRKGKNAYYYAHGNTANGPVWDGKEEPRLLSQTDKVEVSKPLALSFESFSWLDETKSVKIYIDYANADQLEDDKISLVSFSLMLYS